MYTSKYFFIVFVVAYILVYSISVILWGIKMCSGQKQKTTIVPVDNQQQLSYEYNSIDLVVMNKQHKLAEESMEGMAEKA